nr:amino acid ABC transporter ATP-binding protein [uncultured Desulfobacter sp.]
MSDQPVIILNDIHKSYAGVEVLKGISFTAQKGEVIAIIGSSGSGKSTLLRCINLLVTPDEGTVEVCGSTVEMKRKRGRLQPADHRAVVSLRRKIGMVFQHFNLWDHMTALENVTEALVSVHGVHKKEAKARGMVLLKKVGLLSRSAAYPKELSGGECQRVAIARALAIEPQVLLFDEATSALDPELVLDVLAVIRDLAAEGRTMLIVTHEISFVRAVFDRMLFIHNGRIEEQGTPEKVIGNPDSPRCQEFLSKYLTRQGLCTKETTIKI